jgi:hypothetical protein
MVDLDRSSGAAGPGWWRSLDEDEFAVHRSGTATRPGSSSRLWGAAEWLAHALTARIEPFGPHYRTGWT